MTTARSDALDASPFGPEPTILEATLRDGSYVVDFQFTAVDTATVAAALEAVGFRWIEIGHGLGLGASREGHGAAAATDEEYLEAAGGALADARYGMFFIPGIGTSADLRRAAERGMSFVRIGTNITEVDEAEPFIKEAKSLGLVVSYNAMKSYAVSPDEFARRGAMARGWGADVVSLVDSAGGMFPDDIAAYLEAGQSACDAAFGFHGHDNLALAIANTVRAVEAGARVVDSCLQGLGRTPGNAATEILVAILKQRGLAASVDLKGVMDVGNALIRPLLGRQGIDPLALTAGYARFHSSFMSKLNDYASRYGIDIRDLMIRLCEVDQIAAPDDVLERLGQELAGQRMQRTIVIPAFQDRDHVETDGKPALRTLLGELRPQAVKAGKYSALNIVLAGGEIPDMAVSAHIQNVPTHVVGSITVGTAGQLEAALHLADGNVDVVLLDVDAANFGPESPSRIARRTLTKTVLLTYLDSDVWVAAVESQLARMLGEDLDATPVVVVGDHQKSRTLASRMARRGAVVTVLRTGSADPAQDAASAEGIFSQHARPITVVQRPSEDGRAALAKAAALVVWTDSSLSFGVDEIECVSSDACVLDAGIGGLTEEALTQARHRGTALVRVNMWPFLGGTIAAAHDAARVVSEAQGRTFIDGIAVVAGGTIGEAGDVVVDSVAAPRDVIGVADGRGGVKFSATAEDEKRMRVVSEQIVRRLIAPPIASA